MSTLRTYNLQNPDSASVNIELTSDGGAVAAGILTTSQLNVGTGGTVITTTAGGNINIDSGGVYYDATNNRLAIGTTTVNDKVVIAHADDEGLTFKATGADGTTATQITYEDTNGGTGGVLQFDHDNNSFSFETAGSERVRILSSGGLTFNGDTAAANALDDYEEGNWTPTLVGSSGGSGQAYGSQEGQYTKIGNLVTLRFNITLTTLGTFSGPYALIAGFPYDIEGNSTNGVNTVGGGLIYHVTLGSSVIAMGTQLYEGNNRAYFWVKTTAGVSRQYIAGGSLFAAGTQITGTITYQTTG